MSPILRQGEPSVALKRCNSEGRGRQWRPR